MLGADEICVLPYEFQNLSFSKLNRISIEVKEAFSRNSTLFRAVNQEMQL